MNIKQSKYCTVPLLTTIQCYTSNITGHSQFIKMARLTNLVSAICIAYVGANRSFTTTSSWGLIQNIPRGGDASYSSVCEDIKSSIVDQATKKVRPVLMFESCIMHDIPFLHIAKSLFLICVFFLIFHLHNTSPSIRLKISAP